MSVNQRKIGLTCLSLAICTHLYAETASSQVIQVEDTTTNKTVLQLSPIVITATRSAQSIAEIAGTVYSISQQEIAKQAATGKSTADILGLLVPSLTPSTGTSSNYGMTMRGRAVQYLIDGVPQTGSRDSSRQLNSISPSMIERVEVISGATSIYGSGATGGIINIITKQGGQDALAFESKVGVTSGNKMRKDALAYEAMQSMSFNQDHLKGFLGASFIQRGEIQNSQGDRVGPEIAQTDRQDTKTIDLNGNLAWAFSPQQKLSIAAQYYNDEQDSDYAPDYGTGLSVLLRGAKPSLRAVEGLQLNEQPLTQHYRVNTQYEHQDFLGQILNAEAYYRHEQGRFFPNASLLVNSALPSGRTFIIAQSETDIDVWGARLALQKEFEIARHNLNLTYGLDYENEQDKQTVQLYGVNRFIQSNGLQYQPLNKYGFGPDVETSKVGVFLQSHFELSPQLSLQAGVRQERIESEVANSTPYAEAMVADLVSNYNANSLRGGTVKHNATLFNLGTVYALNDHQQIFANFSQGSSLPDVQRYLRDVPQTFVVNSDNIDAIKVNSYELGWRVQAENGLNAGITTFYNTSDKVVRFNGAPVYNIDVVDTDERIYGVESNLQYPVNEIWKVGGSLAYTQGQFKNNTGKWQALDATRVSPLKATLYSDWQFNEDTGLRIQTLAIDGTDKARKDAIKYGSTAPAAIKGFAVMDVIANQKIGPGTLGIGVYNLWNSDYKTVYSQAVAQIFGATSSLPAQGRTYGLSYSVHY